MKTRKALQLLATLVVAASAHAQTPSVIETLSTRAHVGASDDVLISGWILSGSGTADILVRALGPSLSGVAAQLADPVLEVRDMNGDVVAVNDNWKDAQQAAIIATGQQPTNDFESAIRLNLVAGQYTAVVRGKNNTSGVGKVEMIDLAPSSAPVFANIATRAVAAGGDRTLLAGFTIRGAGPRKVLIRGIGPSLGSVGVNAPLENPALTLRDSSGNVLVYNNNWKDTQAAEVAATRPPSRDVESAIVATLAPGSYTAELEGVCGGSGVALVEVYDFGAGTATSIPPSSPVLSCGPAAPSAVVTTTADSGPGSLRAAIASVTPGGTIGFSKTAAGGATNFYDGFPHTITLTSGALTIDKSLTIASPHPNFLAVSGNQASRVFLVNAGTTVTIENLKVTDGAIPSTGSNAGAGIRNAGTLTIRNCIVTNCRVSGASAPQSTFEATAGGGISNIGTLSILNSSITNNAAGAGHTNRGGGVENDNGIVTISDSVVSDNSVTARSDEGNSSGGGIYSWGGTLTVSRSAISRNSSTAAQAAGSTGGVGAGGGVYAQQTALTIDTSQISGNTASGARRVPGGGIFSISNTAVVLKRTTIDGNSSTSSEWAPGGGLHISGDLIVLESTISGNSAHHGGGIYHASGAAVMTMINSTVSGNFAVGGKNVGGAGIYNNFGTAYLTGVTIAGNVVSGDAETTSGGGIFSLALPPEESSRLHCRNTIIAGNNAGSGPDIFGSIRSQGFNLISNTAGAKITGDTTGNVLNRNANLGPLADNGGATSTMRVLPGSPAIDAGTDFTTLGSAIDASTTSVPVQDATGIPDGAGFVLKIDAEQMIVQARSGNTLTVLRGANGTVPAAHSAGAGVNATSDQRGEPRKLGDAVDIGAFETNYTLAITSGATQSAPVGSAFGSAFQLQILDNGQPIAGIAVTFTAPANGASGTFANGSNSVTVVTDANGIATSPAFTANGRTGSYTVVVSLSGNATSIVYELTNQPRPQLLNIATRMKVLTGDNALIAGFIVTGSDPKKIIVRGIGPSLAGDGVGGVLADPELQLFDNDGNVIAANDDWKIAADGSSQQAEIEAIGIAPSNDRESALIATVPSGAALYTAILSGKGGNTGIGLVEVYDLNSAADSKLANISTRGFVETGDDVMIGGIIIGAGANASGTRVIVRAIGPSLTVDGKLADPVLELYDGSGSIVASNNDWKDTQQTEIEATGVAPTNDKESAIVRTLTAGNYTAIVSGASSTTGIGLVEVYNLGQ